MKKTLKYIVPFILVVFIYLICMIWFSPYSYQNSKDIRTVEEKIIINAPSNEVFNYLGNSENATEWSVYVDHITALNPNEYKDGEVGSIRRCFQNKNESGIFWDEEILEVEKNKRRRLSIFNMNGFSVKADNLQTEQLYVDKNGQCEITLTLFFSKGESTWLDELKLFYAAYSVSHIFKGNLEQIKDLNEN